MDDGHKLLAPCYFMALVAPMIRSAKEAREIISIRVPVADSRSLDPRTKLPTGSGELIFGDHPDKREALQYLAALEGPEVRALVKALERFEKNKEFRYGHSCNAFKDCAVEALTQYRDAVKQQ